MKDNSHKSTMEGNISLILDSYDDLFSDFDPRPYSERSLSEDFIDECKRVAREKRENLELRFLVPAKIRKKAEENNIKKRLKGHFKKHFEEREKEIRHDRAIGLVWVLFGIAIMVLSTFVYDIESESFFISFLFIVLNPAGWFMFWEGLHQFFLEYKDKVPMYEFYRKLSMSEISFVSY